MWRSCQLTSPPLRMTRSSSWGTFATSRMYRKKPPLRTSCLRQPGDSHYRWIGDDVQICGRRTGSLYGVGVSAVRMVHGQVRPQVVRNHQRALCPAAWPIIMHTFAGCYGPRAWLDAPLRCSGCTGCGKVASRSLPWCRPRSSSGASILAFLILPSMRTSQTRRLQGL